MNVFLTLTSLALAAAAFAIRELSAHGKLNAPGPLTGFWGDKSWVRKYRVINGVMIRAPKNWYYRLFKIEYKERFPLSATALVWLTDGYHLMGFAMQISICAAISPNDWHLFLACWLVWSLFFNVFYTVFNRN